MYPAYKNLFSIYFFSYFSNKDVQRVDVPIDSCNGTIQYLEHVELFVNLEYFYRGALNIKLTSNSGKKKQQSFETRYKTRM